MSVLSKGQRANIGKAERNELRDVLATTANDYRNNANRRKK